MVKSICHDTRIVGVAIGGSYLNDSMDEFSDLDLVIAVESRDYDEVMDNRREIAASFGVLLAAFTGEHVGEPRLLICLYDEPLVHVDLKFVALDDIAKRVENPAILWERVGRMSQALKHGKAEFPSPDAQWIEDRFWVWVHYIAVKIGRGELFEAIDGFSFLRGKVLGPLCLHRAGGCPSGVRRIETVAPEFAHRLRGTLASYDAADCFRALRVCVELYRSLRSSDGETKLGDQAEKAAMEYLTTMEQRCGL